MADRGFPYWGHQPMGLGQKSTISQKCMKMKNIGPGHHQWIHEYFAANIFLFRNQLACVTEILSIQCHKHRFMYVIHYLRHNIQTVTPKSI